MDKDGAHAQGPGNGTCMLTTGTTKTREYVVGNIVAPHLSQRPDRSAHCLICDLDKALCYLHTQIMLLLDPFYS